MYHINIAENAVHFWRSGSSLKDLCQSVEGNTTDSFSGKYPSRTRISPHKPRIRLKDTVFETNKPVCPSRSWRLLRPEIESVDETFQVLQKFARPWSAVILPYFGSEATANECPLDPRHWKFYKFEAGDHYVKMMMPLLPKVVGNNVFKKNAGTEEELILEAAAEAFIKAGNTNGIVRGKQAWPHTIILTSVQTIYLHNVQLFSQQYIDPELYNSAKQLP